jgi:hypothetical protein
MMPGKILTACLAAAVLAMATAETDAQTRARELGIDGAISFTARENTGPGSPSSAQAWAFPLQRVRIGQPLGDRFQVQVSAAFSVADFGDISTVRFSLGVGGLYRLAGGGDRSGPFVHLGAGLDLLGSYGTDIQWTGIGGVGWRVPVGQYFAFRPAIDVGRTFRSNRRLAGTTITGLLGLSVFTRPDSQ